MAGVGLARGAICHFHATAGMQKADKPARHPVVAEAVRGWRNRAPAPRQAAALTWGDVELWADAPGHPMAEALLRERRDGVCNADPFLFSAPQLPPQARPRGRQLPRR